MKTLRLAFAILAMLAPVLVVPAIAADWEGVFEGTLGKAKIIVELNAGEEKTDYKGGY